MLVTDFLPDPTHEVKGHTNQYSPPKSMHFYLLKTHFNYFISISKKENTP